VRKARAELQAYQEELDAAILKRLEVPHTKYKLVEALPKYNPADVASRLLALTRAGSVKVTRKYLKGQGYITTYQA
jgi:hypothetical protein